MKTVIFDFDGTLADSLDVITDIFEQMTGKAVKRLSKQELHNLRHLPILAIAERLGVPAWRLPWLQWRGRQLMAGRISEIPTFPGLPQVIQALHQDGYQLFVVSSNSRANVRRFLKHHSVDTYFTRIYGGVGLFSKTASLRKILRRNRLKVENCLYVGDESRDIEACHALGLGCIAVEWGFAAPKFLAEHQPLALVSTPAELHQVITKALPL